ncbi:MAG: acyl-CoA dehydrogenase [Flavobacteriales bacterium]|nr:acyl-CoA dehydrogenase [Flavobacteriales bacterium]|tara:strand:- start:14286 stop:15479 length:1194 start_codon:yes stop_codon:yes gene_type:complete
MNFEEIKLKITKFVQDELYPLEPWILNCRWNEKLPKLNELRDKVKAQGLWLPQIPRAYGGLGLTNAQHGEISEILGASPYGHYVFNCQAPDAGNMEILIECGTKEQKKKYLEPLLKGEIRSCFAMTEPDFAGSNPVNMGTIAIKKGKSYIINGHKWFTSGFDGADFAIVMLISNPDSENPHKRASQIIVPTKNKGVEFVRNVQIMGHSGGGWESHSEIKFNDVKVPLSNILGSDGEGFSIAQKRLGPGRIHHCMRWIGICERSFDLMCDRALSRELAHGKKLAEKQTIQNWISECRAEINAARLLVQDAANKIDEHGAYKTRNEISIIKFYCANVLQKVVDCAIQVHGAKGVTDDTILASYYRHERAARIYDGADEVHKSRLARQILKEYAFNKSVN